MNNSYLGIITPRGLETLVVETEHAAPFLLRRATKRPDDAIVFWTVLDERTATNLTRHIECQRFEDAFDQLGVDAIHFGPLFPPLNEDSLIRSA